MTFITNLFKERLSRRDYFFKGAFAAIIGVTIILIMYPQGVSSINDIKVASPQGLIYIATFTAIFIYTLSLQVRRLHDLGKSGYISLLSILLLANLLPEIKNSFLNQPLTLLGYAYSGYLLFLKGENKTNKYGPMPSPSKINNPVLRKAEKGTKIVLSIVVGLMALVLLFFIGVIVYRAFVLNNL